MIPENQAPTSPPSRAPVSTPGNVLLHLAGLILFASGLGASIGTQWVPD